MTRDDRIALGVTLVIAAWLILSALGCAHTCPKCPTPIAPPPVVVVKTPPPCTLPALPDPLPSGFGIPDPPRDGYFVPRQSWALLGGYQEGVRAWIVAAAACLTAGRHAP